MQNTPYMSGLNEGSQNSDASVVSCKGKKSSLGFPSGGLSLETDFAQCFAPTKENVVGTSLYCVMPNLWCHTDLPLKPEASKAAFLNSHCLLKCYSEGRGISFHLSVLPPELARSP